MGVTIGIDLGTTNSVSCIKKLTVLAIPNAEGEDLTPSCVTSIPDPASGSFQCVVGRHSRDLLKQYPEQTITSVKRLMGRDFEDLEVQTIINDQHVGYPITTDASEPGSIHILLDGTRYTPEMISGLILKKLITDGEADLGTKITQAVVTVPAYFSDRQKFATRAACDYAGIKLLRLLPEPTAAAISFGLSELGQDESRTIMVFDLGGGTFDISVLSVASGSFMEITKGGDMWLGGDNIDQLLVEHTLTAAQKEIGETPIKTLINKLAPSDKARFLVELNEKAEAAKITLSSDESANIELFGLLKDDSNQLIDIDVTITRADFSQLLAPIIKRVASIAKQILHEIRFEPELIDTVLMVGGSSLIPAIQDELINLFGAEKVMIHPRPMIAIAEGAALMAAKMTSQNETDKESPAFAMMHSTAHDYYLQLANGKRHRLVARNTPLPVTVDEELRFSHEDQALARLRVFNEADGVLDPVGELWFHKDMNDDVAIKNTMPKLVLRFSVDEDNIITMKAWSATNEQQCVEAQIARGGLAAKLYHDLERTMSFIMANCKSGSIEDDVLCLSRSIVATILSATDPITGATQEVQKRKAQQQIQTLKALHETNTGTLSFYQFALGAQRESAQILSEDEKLRLDTIVDEFKQALDDLNDAAIFETLSDRLRAFYDDVPLSATLARADNLASLLDDREEAADKKKIQKLMNRLITAHQNNDETEKDDAAEQLEEMVYDQMAWSSRASGRFDRDVQL